MGSPWCGNSSRLSYSHTWPQIQLPYWKSSLNKLYILSQESSFGWNQPWLYYKSNYWRNLSGLHGWSIFSWSSSCYLWQAFLHMSPWFGGKAWLNWPLDDSSLLEGRPIWSFHQLMAWLGWFPDQVVHCLSNSGIHESSIFIIFFPHLYPLSAPFFTWCVSIMSFILSQWTVEVRGLSLCASLLSQEDMDHCLSVAVG